MCYALSFIFLFGIGGLTGLFLGALATDVHLHDTYFVVAHFHYVMFGGVMIAFLGALHYWWPKMTGRMYSDLWGRVAALLLFIAFNLTFFPQFVLGTKGNPRRYFDYSQVKDQIHVLKPLHVLSTIGAFLLLLAFLIMLIYLLQSLFRGKKAPANPWGSNTLEWKCSSPPPPHNFETPPPVSDPYDYANLTFDESRGEYVEKSTPAEAPAG
jgi:cytochrome c oxidase subunit 1